MRTPLWFSDPTAQLQTDSVKGHQCTYTNPDGSEDRESSLSH
jgi:hypothetical protein